MPNYTEYSPLANAFAEMVARRAGLADDATLLALLKALTHSMEESHSALDVQAWCVQAEENELPLAQKALEILRETPEQWNTVVDAQDRDDDIRPVVWCQRTGLLYLRKYRQAEKAIGAFVRQRLGNNRLPGYDTPPEEAVQAVSRNFLSAESEAQRRAVQAAYGKRLAMVTGGPGTGKTTTLGAILALELQKTPALRIALCAPTGKAAAQMRIALQEQLQGENGTPAVLQCDDGIRQTLNALLPTTVHKFLGTAPHRQGIPRFHHANPLPHDLVVVDEGSMVDLLLFHKLLDALPDTTRLLLLGDKDQLASVAPGAVFAELASVLQTHDCYQWLTYNFRSRAIPELVEFARRLAEHDFSTATTQATALYGQSGNTAIFQAEPLPQHNQWEQELRKLKNAWNLAKPLAGSSPDAYLDFQEEWKILCAVNDGPCGVTQLNDLLAKILEIPAQGDGMPMMLTRNDALSGLQNGDVGVFCQGKLWFRQVDKSTGEFILRSYLPAQLPECVPAFAITIHKSQGSSYRNVLVILPDAPENPLLNLNLVYTAITRARKRCRIWAAPSVLQHAITTLTHRTGALAKCCELS